MGLTDSLLTFVMVTCNLHVVMGTKLFIFSYTKIFFQLDHLVKLFAKNGQLFELLDA